MANTLTLRKDFGGNCDMGSGIEHLLRGRIVHIFEGKRRTVFDIVRNEGIVSCACGWSSGQQRSLIQAQQVADAEHPEGIKNHPKY